MKIILKKKINKRNMRSTFNVITFLQYDLHARINGDLDENDETLLGLFHVPLQILCSHIRLHFCSTSLYRCFRVYYLSVSPSVYNRRLSLYSKRNLRAPDLWRGGRGVIGKVGR